MFARDGGGHVQAGKGGAHLTSELPDFAGRGGGAVGAALLRGRPLGPFERLERAAVTCRAAVFGSPRVWVAGLGGLPALGCGQGLAAT